MPAIRCKHNYRKYVLNQNGLVFKSSIVGNTVLLERPIDDVFMPFGGFLNMAQPEMDVSDNLVNLINIEAFTADDDGLNKWVDLPKESKVRGRLLNNQVFVLIGDKGDSIYCT
jgi:hypothetical protein